MTPATVACGSSTGPDYITKHGINCYLQDLPGPTEEELETATDLMIEVLVNYVGFPYTRDRINKRLLEEWETYQMIVMPGTYFECAGSPSGLCAGQFTPYYKTIQTLYSEKCVALTALEHELVHFFNWLIEHKVDVDHQNPTFFPGGCMGIKDEAAAIDCTSRSAENVANMELCRAFCPEMGCH